MLSYCNNDYLRDNTSIITEYQMLFYQKMKELLHMHSGISYSFKIHNSYTILKELHEAIIDYEKNKIVGMIVEEIRKEAKRIVSKDLVIKAKCPELFEIIKEEINTGLTLDKNTQIAESSLPGLNTMKGAIKQLFRIFTPIDYFKQSIILTKNAIDNSNGEEILHLCPVIVSSSLMVGRTISGMYKAIEVLFQNKVCSFDDNWRKWSACMLCLDSPYKCLIKINDNYKSLLENCQFGSDIKQEYASAKNIDYIDENASYLILEIQAAASDLSAIFNKVYTTYSNQLSIVEFATAKVGSLEKCVYAFDEHNKSFIKIEQQETNSEYIYKPFNQYHVNIDRAVKNFVDSLGENDYAKAIGTITNVCNFEGDSNEYRFLLLWSSLEALFRSTQYETAIGAIKNIIPEIMTRRYIYYRLFDFVKDAEKAHIEFIYQNRIFIKNYPSDQDIQTLYELLQDPTEYQNLADLCKQKYVLLYYKCNEIKNMVINAGSIRNTIVHHRETLEFHLQRMYRVRNKFVHHAEIDANIDALYKHLLVYSWECIREMSYVSEKRGIKSLEELYSYFRMNYKISLKHLRDASASVDFNYIKNGYLL